MTSNPRDNDLRWILAERGLTQRQFAAQTGFPKATLISIIAGQHEPSPATMIKLAKALNTTTDHVLTICNHHRYLADI